MAGRTIQPPSPPGAPGQPDIGYTPDHGKYLERGKRRRETEDLATTLPLGFPQQLRSELVWDGNDLAERYDWNYSLDKDDVNEIELALQHFKATMPSLKKPLGFISQETFPLPNLHRALREVSREVHSGHGFKVIRGVPVTQHTREENIIIYAGISAHVGPIRGSAGGQSYLASSWKVYNELAATRPDLIPTLAEPWATDTFGKSEKPFLSAALLYHQAATATDPERLIIQYARRSFTGYWGLPRSPYIPPIRDASRGGSRVDCGGR
ncbi:hypothetical protein BT67DRAFT_449990 [Trichocladium antarcticum]|uniref:Uncharacterized protein n=1 Tax=Trichocladium antarcticum TaxID=1450529 RepID=A0AAN6UJJ5_9PEZI|nr:hypothetical protein BT67DRAFT_449990 [Trichocladium antarcticum]